MDIAQLAQVVGALLILAAFIGAQLRMTATSSTAYLVLNLVGSALLGYLAWADRQWGFLLLEGVWAIVSAWGLLAARRPARV